MPESSRNQSADPLTPSSAKGARTIGSRLIPKEISWLSFNERVLQEAADADVPVVQRLRFLGIFANNLDEFFRVRVANVKRLASFSSSARSRAHYARLLRELQERTEQLQSRFDRTCGEVLAALRNCGIYLIDETQLDPRQSAFVNAEFDSRILPELDPILLDDNTPLPNLRDGGLYLAIRIASAGGIHHSLLEIPTDRVSRFVPIPPRRGGGDRVFMVLENVIRHCIEQVYRGVIQVDRVEAYAIKITMDAELELDDDVNQSLIDRVARSLERRQTCARLERLVYDSSMPEDLLQRLTDKLKLGRYDSVVPAGRYHNAGDFMDFPSLEPASLEYVALSPLPVPEMREDVQRGGGSILDQIRQRDILLYYPYHSFELIISFLKTAAIDPAVKRISISLYRVARQSRVVDALLSARRNGKEVTAVVELQARFDEAANIDLANRLSREGVNVVPGVPGLKVHAKLILVCREETGGIRYYSHIGTGNFNERTATTYTDFSLLTCDPNIGRDVGKAFDFISHNKRGADYHSLWISPQTTRTAVASRIEREITHASSGLPAAITIKCNNLTDRDLIGLLCRAATAGVRVRIICRGMCSLVPEGSDNIEVISIVDRFLEHPRVFVFHNGGEPEYYISSADLMTRNLDYRVEATAPVLDPRLRNRLRDILDIQWWDNTKARIVDRKQSNRIRHAGMAGRVRSQTAIHHYLRTGRLPEAVTRARQRWHRQLEEKTREPLNHPDTPPRDLKP